MADCGFRYRSCAGKSRVRSNFKMKQLLYITCHASTGEAMAFDGAYKPRRLTGAEQAAEPEQAVKKKARLIRRVRNESDANSKP